MSPPCLRLCADQGPADGAAGASGKKRRVTATNA